MSATVVATTATAFDRARHHPRALLVLWGGQIAFSALALLLLRASLGSAFAHRPPPGVLEIGALALKDAPSLLPALKVAAALLLLYALLSPLLHALAARALSGPSDLPPFPRVMGRLQLPTVLFTMARATVLAAWVLSWPQIDRQAQQIADERWQLAMLALYWGAGLLLFGLLSLLLRHVVVAIALGWATEARPALQLVLRAHQRSWHAIWSCWLLERGIWLGCLLCAVGLQPPTLALGLGSALGAEGLLLLRLAGRAWGLAAVIEVLGHRPQA